MIKTKMMSFLTLAVVLTPVLATAHDDSSERTIMVGGAMMSSSKDIVDNAVNSKEHTTLIAAVKAADLFNTLKGKGPFTVFAPTNAAFEKLPTGTVDTLLKPQNKSKLVSVLTYHVVPGKLSAHDLMDKINAGNGQVKLKTVEGNELIFKLVDGKIKVMDNNGDVANITTADVFQSNGVVHIIDTVLIP